MNRISLGNGSCVFHLKEEPVYAKMVSFLLIFFLAVVAVVVVAFLSLVRHTKNL